MLVSHEMPLNDIVFVHLSLRLVPGEFGYHTLFIKFSIKVNNDNEVHQVPDSQKQNRFCVQKSLSSVQQNLLDLNLCVCFCPNNILCQSFGIFDESVLVIMAAVLFKLLLIFFSPFINRLMEAFLRTLKFTLFGLFLSSVPNNAICVKEAAIQDGADVHKKGSESNEELHETLKHTPHIPWSCLGQFVLTIVCLLSLVFLSRVEDGMFDLKIFGEKHEFCRGLFFWKRLIGCYDESCLNQTKSCKGVEPTGKGRVCHAPSGKPASQDEHQDLLSTLQKMKDWSPDDLHTDFFSEFFPRKTIGGVPSKFCVFPGQPHTWGKPEKKVPLWTSSFEVWPIHRFLPDALSSPEQDMASVGYRLATLGALPASCHVSRLKLADAGFYYRGESDEVVCYSCRARHRGWSSSDDPLSVHRRLSPGCCHLTQAAEAAPGHKARNHGDAGAAGGDASDAASGTGALVNGSGPDHSEDGEPRLTNAGHATSADEADRSSSLASASSSTTSHNAAADVADLRSEPSGGHLARGMLPTPKLELGGAVYPMYQDTASRRKSFARWDQARAPPLDDILLNGMFYAGYADCVRCFYCGVGLKSWQPTDDVWSEHIRWRPDCQFLRTVKGDDYIRRVTARLNREAASDPNSTDTVSSVRNSDHSSLPPTRAAAANPASSRASATSVATTASTTTTGNPTLSMSPHTDSLQTSTGSAPTETLTNPSETSSETDTTTRPPAVSSNNDCRDETNDPRSQESGISVVPPNEDSESERLDRLRRENRELAGRMQCRVCNGRPIDTIFLPCGHLLACEVCTATLRECPLCREYIQATARVHMG